MGDISLQELLKVLETEPEKVPDLTPYDENNPLRSFIRARNISVGLDRIPTYVIYYLYKEKHKGDMSKIDFFRNFKKDFTQVRTGKQRCYLLSAQSFDLSEDGLMEAAFYCKGTK